MCILCDSITLTTSIALSSGYFNGVGHFSTSCDQTRWFSIANTRVSSRTQETLSIVSIRIHYDPCPVGPFRRRLAPDRLPVAISEFHWVVNLITFCLTFRKLGSQARYCIAPVFENPATKGVVRVFSYSLRYMSVCNLESGAVARSH